MGGVTASELAGHTVALLFFVVKNVLIYKGSLGFYIVWALFTLPALTELDDGAAPCEALHTP